MRNCAPKASPGKGRGTARAACGGGGEAPAVPAQRIVNSMTGGVKMKSAKLMTLPFQGKASFCIIPLS